MEEISPVSQQVLDWKPKTARTLRTYLKRWVWINYAANLLAVFMAMFVIFSLAIYIAGRWSFYNPPFGHPVTLFHCAHALVLLLLLRFWAWPRIKRPQSLTELANQFERGDRRVDHKNSDDDALEYTLEAQDDRLASAVTSALEFSDPDPILQECLIPSRNLLAGSGRASETKGFYERTLIDLKKRKLWKWAIPVSLWITIVLAVLVGSFGMFLDRFEPFTAKDALKFYKENFLVNPYRPLHDLVVTPGSVDTVLKGESFKVLATLMGPGTHEAEITYYMHGFPEQVADMKNNGPPNSWAYEFENLQSDLTYRVKAGPLISASYTAMVRIPPELTSIRLTYYYPDFMKKKFEVMPAGQGAAVAPLGTTVEVTTQWNQSMDQIAIVVNGKESFPMRREGNYYKGTFPLASAGAYVLAGTSSEGVRTRGDIEFPIQAMIDLPPEIEWEFPQKDLDFSQTRRRIRRIPLRFKASDDFGLHSIALYAGAPGRPTSTYEVARIDGKEKEFSGEFVFDLRPFETVPVCRVFFLAMDNHPGTKGTSTTEVRRLYFQPPGSFAEEESDGPKYVEGDPFEMTANELFALIKMQREQNMTLNEETDLAQKEKNEWLERQKKVVQLTTRTVILVKERMDNVLSGPGDPNESIALPSETVVEGEPEEEVDDLSTRLQQVINRLSGGIQRLDELQPGKKPTGNSALDRQLKQWDAGEEGRNRRSREEGDRALTELELAFKELTGKDLPVSVEDELEELEEKDREGEGEGPGDGKAGDEGEGEDGELKEGEEGEGKDSDGEDEGEQVSKKKGGKDRSDTWATVDGSESTGTFTPGEEEEGGDEGEGEKEVTGSGANPTAPTNQYQPSTFSLDPETVQIDSPASSLMRKELSRELSGIDLNQYRDQEIPKEYRSSASEYGQAMTGE